VPGKSPVCLLTSRAFSVIPVPGVMGDMALKNEISCDIIP